jgi:hypothetical protein
MFSLFLLFLNIREKYFARAKDVGVDDLAWQHYIDLASY